MARCPHGDPFCPCQDGDSCHYEGPDPFSCPNPPPAAISIRVAPLDAEGRIAGPARALATRPHCHVEGCRWHGEMTMIPVAGKMTSTGVCGLLRLAPSTSVNAAYELGCGAIRSYVELPRRQAKS